MIIKQTLVFFISLLFSMSSLAASKWSGDWFEIEVILLSQLEDKALLKESFTKNPNVPSYQNGLDLIRPYLNPDITSLKQQLPRCDAPQYPLTLLEQSSHLPVIHPILPLDELADLAKISLENANKLAAEQLALEQLALEQVGLEQALLINESAEVTAEDDFELQQETNQEQASQDDFFDRVQTSQEQQIASEIKEGTLQEEQLSAPEAQLSTVNSASSSIANNIINTDDDIEEGVKESNEGIDEENVEITPEQRALVLQAEQAFSKQPFNFQPLYQETENNIFCRITNEQFQQLSPDKSLYSYHGFAVDVMPTVINNPENLFSDTPYLLSRSSLQLNDIVKQLKRSKNFRPLLHLAWRQQVFEEQDSTPVKLYAGDNLKNHYEQNHALYLREKHAEAEQEELLAEVLNLSPLIDDKSFELSLIPTTKQLINQAKQQRLEEIIDTISAVDDLDTVLAGLGEKALTLNNAEYELPTEALMITAPQEPLQPWFLNGWLNIYLKGVYLNVNADFNILNLTLAEQETLKLRSNNESELIAIPFQQKRRMISQEVHYFDHPYMGMIVQIRRHKRPEIEIEIDELDTESESIN